MDKINQENKKNFPKFMRIMLGCTLVGMVCGIVLPNINMETLGQHLSDFFRATAVYYCPAVMLLLTLPSWLYLRKAKARFALWDGEDEDTDREINVLLDHSMSLSNFSTFISLLSLAFCLVYLGSSKSAGDGIKILIGTAVFFLNVGLLIWLQKEAVDTVKRMNPEKSGSVFDPKFMEKWEQGLDEAEVQAVGRASYVAFKWLMHTGAVVFAVLCLLEIAFGIGIWPFLVVTVMTIVPMGAYFHQCIKEDKKR